MPFSKRLEKRRTERRMKVDARKGLEKVLKFAL